MRATVSNDFGFKGMHHDDMKLAFKRLIKIHHPDLGGDTATCQLLNAEFAYWYARAATEHVKAEKTESATDDKKREYYQNHYSVKFAESLEELIRNIYATNIDLLDGIEIDLIGVFVWIRGIKATDKDVQTTIKSLGFTGGFKRHDDGTSEYMWKCTPMLRRFGADPNIDNIERKYGKENKNRRASNGLTVYR